MGNIAGDSLKFRDLVLSAKALTSLLQLAASSRLTIVRNVAWTISNLCRRKPAPSFDQFKPALPVLSRLICCDDTETVTDATWALSYLSNGPNDRIQAVIDAGVVPHVIKLLDHASDEVQIPAVRTVGKGKR